ncbi:UNVERIFIED_ORG: hypothetical protein ABIC62_006496 [Burkholderia sp. 1595]|uniref:Uncharacterized protein n=1 Tax=Paraburkholderia terricola TaxID=169427 RepID=A0ABU1M215_9BURK|nr:hypothetical protein [Paraburkholderia terricola]MDR6485199.1 hypothetical protein [Paraburkholderia terricola]
MVFHNIEMLGVGHKMEYHNLKRRHSLPLTPDRRTI